MGNTRVSHYEITRRLGRGGMGEVFEAKDLDLGRSVALKFVAAEMTADAEALKRLEREARAAAALQHPHIATLYAFERDGGRSFIAMELMSGGTVRERILAGRLPIGQALAIARDTAAALAHAHRRGIVHRDVKPENLMFSEGGIVKLMDFGLARAAQASRLTMTGSALGTAAYMPPEATRGGTGAPGDIFSLGVMLHEMLAGELPFAGDTPLALLYTSANEPPRSLRAARPEVPDGVVALVGRMLAKDPAARPEAATVARELALLTGVPAPAGIDAGADEHAETISIADAERAVAPEPGRRFPRGWAGWLLILMPVAALVGVFGLLIPVMMQAERGDRHTTAVALNNQGYELLQQDSVSAARTAFEGALKADARYPEAMLNLAEALRRSGDANGAASWYGRVIREFPADRKHLGMAHYQLGEIDMAAGAIPSAINHYRNALERDSTDVRYHNNLAFALISAGQPNDAIPVIRAALDRFPGEARLHKNFGLALLRSGAPRDALRELGAALDRDAGLASAWALRAEAKAQLRDFPGARADWNSYLGMAHDEAERADIETRLRALGAIAD